MKILTSANVPDSTYFRTGDAEPTINEDGSVTVLDGEGSRRSWGKPGITSTVVHEDCDLVAIHVGFHHKHGGGQFWRYYTTDGTKTRQVTWASLPDSTRQKVLDAYNAKAPGWAKVPGKLRTNYAKPSATKRTSYKLLTVDGEALRSLYNGEEYTIGKRKAEAVAANAGENDWGDVIHAGGYYSHPTAEQVKALWSAGSLVPADCVHSVKAVALVECEISGRVVKFPNGKLASTYLTPVRIVEQWTV
jgi:hypothetical protein